MQNWWDRAACKGMSFKGMPTDLFFPTKGETSTKGKAVCRNCPVTKECLADALRHESPFEREGVYGGLDPRERDRLFNESEMFQAVV